VPDPRLLGRPRNDHLAIVDLDELPVVAHPPDRHCEFGDCEEPAEVYGGYAGAWAWAGYACLPCAAQATGYSVWERLA